MPVGQRHATAEVTLHEVEVSCLGCGPAAPVGDVAVKGQVVGQGLIGDEIGDMTLTARLGGGDVLVGAVAFGNRVDGTFPRHDALKEPRGDPCGPGGGLLQAQGVKHDGGGIADSQLADGSLFHGLARGGEHDLHFRVGVAAVAGAQAAMVGGDDEQGILQQAQLVVGIVELVDPDVLLLDLFQVDRCTVARAVACGIGLVQMDEQHRGRAVSVFYLLGNVVTGHLDDLHVGVGRFLVDSDAVLNDTDVDVAPVAEGGQGCLRHLLADHAEEAGELGIGRIGTIGGNAVVQSVELRCHTVEQTAPGLGADRGGRGDALVGHSTVGKDLVQIPCFGLLEEGTRAVHTHDDNVLVDVLLDRRFIRGSSLPVGGGVGSGGISVEGSTVRCISPVVGGNSGGIPLEPAGRQRADHGHGQEQDEAGKQILFHDDLSSFQREYKYYTIFCLRCQVGCQVGVWGNTRPVPLFILFSIFFSTR